jgi:hypothetical protein
MVASTSAGKGDARPPVCAPAGSRTNGWDRAAKADGLANKAIAAAATTTAAAFLMQL